MHSIRDQITKSKINFKNMVTIRTTNGSQMPITTSKVIILSHSIKMMRNHLKMNTTIVMRQISKFSKIRQRKIQVAAKKWLQIVINIKRVRIIHHKRNNTRNRQMINILGINKKDTYLLINLIIHTNTLFLSETAINLHSVK